MTHHHFDEAHLLHELKHYLPSQTPIKEFIHHNTLHAFQGMKFYDAIFKASKIFGYQVSLQLQEFRELYAIGRIRNAVLERVIADIKGAGEVAKWKDKLLHTKYDTHNEPRIGKLRASWKSVYGIDLDNLVQPLLFRILCAYLDQGVSIQKFPVVKDNFLDSIREMEKNSFSSFFKTKRVKQLFLVGDCSLPNLLKLVVGDENYFEQYVFDQQFTHQGWSGLVNAVEDHPYTLMDKRPIALRELIVFELLLELDALDNELGSNWKPISQITSAPPMNQFDAVASTELQEVFKLWQDSFEWSYYDEVLSGISLQLKKEPSAVTIKSFQAMFCIDERECSIRRHIESVDKTCETLGTPGFFGVEFYFKAEHANFYDKLCPAPVYPNYLIKEHGSKHKREHELLYTDHAHTFLGGALSSVSLGFGAGVKLLQTLFRPRMSSAISDAFTHMHNDSQLSIENKHVEDRENNLQIGYTLDEMTNRAENVLRSVGLIKNFSPIVYSIAHGSSSANNPHHSAHDCGACSGRPGSVNARVFAHIANHDGVRNNLRARGIDIPSTTQFVGGLHDTAADQIDFYDERKLNTENKTLHAQNKISFEKALDLNAKERTRRFASIKTKASLKHTRKEILKRSVSMFEPRPELGHGTNSLCIVARRDITKGLFMDRRAFMNSYDYRTDPEGKLLTAVMRPIGLVCGGINLEYYFSRVDNYKLGAGTKLPHNVMGLFGVANSSDGDLRPGLPVQMIEVHDPVRLLVIVEHYPEKVLNTIMTTPEMYEWYNNEWVHIMAIHPETKEFYYHKDGAFQHYTPLPVAIEKVADQLALVEKAKEMETNYIVDATQENLPIYTLN